MMVECRYPNVVSRLRAARVSTPVGRYLYVLFFFSLWLDTLAAYSLFSIPVPWFAACFSILLLSALIVRNQGILKVPRCALLILALIPLGATSLMSYNFVAAPPPMPSRATLPYPMFLATRFFVMFRFFATLVATYNLCLARGASRVLDTLWRAVVLVCVAAIYIYFAQVYGLWEPERTRIGTGGQDFTIEPVKFSYAFHRALGTFREPSHLAQWLAGPTLIFISRLFRKFSMKDLLAVALSLVCLILSGSLLGLLSLVGGMLVLLLFQKGTSRFNRVLLFCVGAASLYLVATFFGVDYLGAVIPRLEALAATGVETTGRYPVWWGDVLQSPPPVLGYGIGNANLILSAQKSSPLVMSFLSLFLNSFYSMGFLGLVLVSAFLLVPFAFLKVAYNRADATLMGCFAGHVGWVISYFGHAEEFSLIHAALLGILFAQARTVSIQRVSAKSSSTGEE